MSEKFEESKIIIFLLLFNLPKLSVNALLVFVLFF